MDVHILMSHSDDYHGGSVVVDVFATKELAEAAKLVEQAKPACSDCGDRPYFAIHSTPLKGA